MPGCLTIALAMAILYFWPPDNLFPFKPQFVLKPSGNSTSFKVYSLSSKISSIGENTPSSISFFLISSKAANYLSYLSRPINFISSS